MIESTPEERYGPTSGLVLGVLGLLVCVVVLAFAVAGGLTVVPVRIAIGALAGAVLVWAYLLRPRIIMEEGGETLLLRNPMVSHRIPLAAVRFVAVKMVTTVRTADARYDAVAVGYSLRALRGGRPDAGAGRRGLFPSPRLTLDPEPAVSARPQQDEQTMMTERILAAADRARTLGLSGSPPTRTLAVVEIVLLVLLALGFAATYLF